MKFDFSTLSCRTRAKLPNPEVWGSALSYRCVFAVLLLAILINVLGCSSLGRRRSQGNAIAAREMTRLGQEAMVESRWKEAETRLAHAVELSPDNVTARRHYAHALWRLDKQAAAIQHLHHAVQMSGGDPIWTVELGEMLLSQGKLGDALAAANEALQTDDRLAAGWVLRATVLLQQGDEDQALNDFLRARSLGPVAPKVLSHLAAIYEHKQRPHRVLATLQRLQDQVGVAQVSPGLLHSRGLALRQVGRLDEAIESFAIAHQRNPNEPGMLVAMADCQFEAGYREAARQTMERAQALGPRGQQSSRRELVAGVQDEVVR